MITLSKLKIYERYKGDLDLFGRAAGSSERELISEVEWYLIDTLLQDTTVIEKRLGSEQRTAEAESRLRESAENDEVIAEIRRLVLRL